jgi:hypothetical protein
MVMKSISLLLAFGALTLGSAQSYADKSHLGKASTPASKEWVLEQLAQTQSTLESTLASKLTAADWTNLCLPGQSIDSTTGCTPNCAGAQKAACTKMLGITELEDQTLLSSTAPTGLSVFRLTVQPTFANNAPVFNNGSSNNSIRCQTFTVKGTLLNNQNDNFLLNSSTEANYQQYTAGVDLSVFTSTAANNLLERSPNDGAQRLNQRYYVACMAYTTLSNVATNVNMDGTLSITWT